MAIRSIAVQVDTDSACSARLSYAAAIADASGASLSGVFAKGGLGGYGAYDFVSDVSLMELREQAMNQASVDATKIFHETLGDKADIKVVEGPWPPALVAQAHVSDLLVVAQPNPDDERATAPGGVAGDAVMAAGIPVVFVPYIGATASMPKTIIVGWKDSREATRAVRDALPFMSQAKVHVVTASRDDGPDVGGQQVVDYLTAHNIDAAHMPSPTEDVGVGDVLLSRAADIGADMIVIGGYSHNRWRETILGGVTRDLLRQMTVPVLMSH